MKRSIFTGVAALGLIGTAQAQDNVCDHCEYIRPNYGPYVPWPSTYLGNFWPGDRATFQDVNIKADRYPYDSFNDFWIFDVNQNGVAVVTISNKKATAFGIDPVWSDGEFAVEITAVYGTTCPEGLPGTLCMDDDGQGSGEDVRLSEWSPFGHRHRTFTSQPLVPGRYELRIVGWTRGEGESAYTGTMTVRAKL